MLPFYQALELLALQSSRVGGSVDHIASTLATVYRAEITLLPWPSGSIGSPRERVGKFTHDQLSELVLLVIRDLQAFGRAILVEHNLGDDDTAHDCRMTFAPGHALIIQRHWDALGNAPAWAAFERQLKEVS